MAKTTSFFEDLNGSSNKDSKDNAGASSDLLSIASLAKDTPAPAASQKSEPAKVELASVTPDTKAKPADTTSSLPKLAMVDTASIIGTSQTIRLTGAEIENPPEKGGFLSGLTDGGAKIVTGMAKMVLNEEKTSEQRAKDADRSLAGNLVNTGHTLATTVTDSKARAAIGDAIADQTKKVMSGDTYAIGETTAFVGSFFIPGAATAKGTSGLTNTGRALNTATKMDDALGLVSRVKPGSVIDDMATKFRPGSVLDDAARANPAVTLGDEASAIAARTAKPGPVIPSSPSFTTRLSTTVEDLSVAARRTVNETIEAFTGRSVPKLATETGTGATLRTGNGTSLFEGLGVKTPGNVTPGRFTLPRTGKPGSILDEIGTGSLADDVAKGPKPVVAERAPAIREAKPVVHEASPVAEAKPVIREATPVIRDTNPVVTRTLEESKGALARQTENAGTVLRQSSDDFTRTLDDLATKSGPQARGPIQSVKQLAEEIKTGNAGAEAVVKLEQSMKDLGRALPENLADDFSRLATKADDLKMATGRNTATREISTGVKEATDTAVAAERTLGQASRNFTTSLDDLVRNVAKEDPALARTLQTKVDDIKVISEKLATGADDTAARTQLQQAVKRLGDDVPAKFTDDLRAVTGSADDLGIASSNSRVAKVTARETASSGEVAAEATRVMTEKSGSFSTALDDLVRNVAKEDPALARTLRTKVDDIKELSGQIAGKSANGADDVVARAKMQEALKNLGDDVPAKFGDDLRTVTRSADDFTSASTNTRLATETAREVATTGRLATESTRVLGESTNRLGTSLDDLVKNVAKEDPALARTLQTRVDDIKELSGQIAGKTVNGADDVVARAKMQEALKSLGDDVPAKFADDLRTVTRNADDFSTATANTRVATETAREVTTTGRLATESTRVLGDSTNRLSTSLDDLVRNVAKEDPALARTLQTKVDDIKELSGQIAGKTANGADDVVARAKMQEALKSLGDDVPAKFGDDLRTVTRNADDFSTASANTRVVTETAREVATTGRLATESTRVLGDSTKRLGTSLDDLVKNVAKEDPALARTLQTRVDNIKELSGQIAGKTVNGADDVVARTKMQDALKSLGDDVPAKFADDLRTVTRNADDFSTATANTRVATETAREVAGAGRLATESTRVLGDSTKRLSTSLDDLVRKVADDNPNIGRNLRTRVEEIKDLSRQIADKTATGADDAVARTRLQEAVKQLGDDVPAKFADDLRTVTRNADDFGTASANTRVATETAREVSGTARILRESTKDVNESASRLSQTVNSTREGLVAKLPAEIRPTVVNELDNIAAATRELGTSASPRAVGNLRTSVERLVEATGANTTDDVLRVAREARELLKNVSRRGTAEESFAQASSRARRIPQLGDDLVTRSGNISDDISLLSRRISDEAGNNGGIRTAIDRARGRSNTGLVDDLKVVDDAVQKIGKGTETAATLRKAEEALERLSTSSGKQFGPQISNVVDDTRALIKAARETRPIAAARTGADDLVRFADDLSVEANKVLTRPGSQLPAKVGDDLRSISEASRRLGRAGGDDLAELSTIENSMQRLRTNIQKVEGGQTLIDDLERAVERTRNQALEVARTTRIANLTDDATREANKVGTLVREVQENVAVAGKPSRYVSRQLKELDDTARNLVDSADPSVGIRSMRQNIANLKEARVNIPRALEESVEVLSNRATGINALRNTTNGAKTVERIREAVTAATTNLGDDATRAALRTGDDITIKAGTETRVKSIVDDLADDSAALRRSEFTKARNEIQKSIDNSLTALRESGNARLANQLDEALQSQRFQQVQDANRLLAGRIEAQAADLVPAAARPGRQAAEGALATAAKDTATLTRIETAARKLAAGDSNPQHLASITRSLEELSPSLQRQLKPIVEELKLGVTEGAKVGDSLVTANARMVSDSLTRNGRLLQSPETFASVRQRLDVIRTIQGDSETLRQLGNLLHEMEADMARIANPATFRSMVNWTSNRLGITRAPAHVEGLTSDSAKIRELLGASESPSFFGNLSRVLSAEPQLAGQLGKDLAWLGGGVAGTYFVADAWIRGYSNEINARLEKIAGESVQSSGEITNGNQTRAEDKAAFLKVDSAAAAEETRRDIASRSEASERSDRTSGDDNAKASVLDFSPVVSRIVRAAGRLEQQIELSKLTGIMSGSDFEMADTARARRDFGKLRTWSGLAAVAPAVETAQTILPPFKPITFKTREPDIRQPQVNFEKPAQPRFSPRKVAELMSKLKDKESIEESGTRLAGIYGGSAATTTNYGTVFGNTLRSTSLRLIQSGMEKTEANGLDNAGTGGAANQAPNTFTTYASNTGMQFTSATNDPNNNNEEEDRNILVEALESGEAAV